MTNIKNPKASPVRSLTSRNSKALNPPPTVKHFPMRPYQQGAFDSYCGLYSIINATRLISFPSDGIGEEFCEDMFDVLTKYTNRMFGLRRLGREGMPLWLMKRLLLVNCRYLAYRTKMTTSYSRFLFRMGNLPVHEVLQMMREDLAEARCAFIIELQGTHSHWTVVRSVSDAQVQLFDSDGLKLLKMADTRMSYNPKSQNRPHVLRAGSVLKLCRSSIAKAKP